MEGEDDIRFEVEFEDGQRVGIMIAPDTLAPGEHVARIVAEERQRAGDLPPSRIVAVRRAKLP
jgi:hypothetical protein